MLSCHTPRRVCTADDKFLTVSRMLLRSPCRRFSVPSGSASTCMPDLLREYRDPVQRASSRTLVLSRMLCGDDLTCTSRPVGVSNLEQQSAQGKQSVPADWMTTACIRRFWCLFPFRCTCRSLKLVHTAWQRLQYRGFPALAGRTGRTSFCKSVHQNTYLVTDAPTQCVKHVKIEIWQQS